MCELFRKISSHAWSMHFCTPMHVSAHANIDIGFVRHKDVLRVILLLLWHKSVQLDDSFMKIGDTYTCSCVGCGPEYNI